MKMMDSAKHFLRFVLLTIILPLVHPLSTTCRPQEEVLFVEDPTDRQAFLSCKPYGNSPTIGFWERHYCPNDMHFEYRTQQCTANRMPPNMVREANDILQIAILNGSCARGEQCIGGTVCDPQQHRCLCPQGTLALLETLSCAPLPSSYQQQQYWRAQVRPLSGFPLGPFPQYPQPIMQQIQVPPGSSCERGEYCTGGSVCMRTLGVCVCPTGTENQNGQCLPLSSKLSGGSQSAKETLGQGGFFKVPLGEQCNDYLGLLCADQSAICANGRCQCVPPMAEKDGHCQMPPREAVPGELCNAGQTCVRGSVCSKQIPICVCPQGTELVNGWCVPGQQQQLMASTTVNPPTMIPIASAESTAMLRMRPRGKEAQVGEKCSLNADCASGAYCNGNTQPPTCQCLSTHVSVNNHCEKVIYPGQNGCETDLQCSAGYAGARCINGQCVCPPGSTAIEQTCIPAVAWPGEACNVSRLMPICSADSYCFEGRCICNPPLSLFQKQCIPRSEPIWREEVEEMVRKRRECFQHSECARGKRCSAEGHCEPCEELAGNCVRLEEFGGLFGIKPFNDGEGGEEAQRKEIRQAIVGQKDKLHSKNDHEAAGRNNTQGGIEQIFSALTMLRKSALDRLIGRHQHAKNSSSSVDDHKKDRGRREVTIRKTTSNKKRANKDGLPHGHRLEGEPCSPGQICLNGTVCEDGHCKCPKGKSCISQIATFRPIGTSCREDIDRCIGGSSCLQSQCKCTDGASSDAQHLNCRQRPGGRCSAGQICSGRSECRLGICQCRIGFRMNARAKKCVRRVALPGQSCQDNEKCLGDSECGFGQVCLCPPDQIVKNGTKCEKRGQTTENVPMNNGKDPLEGAADDPNAAVGGIVRLVTAKPGQSCAKGEACTGGSICRHGRICSCAPGEHVPAGGSACVSKEGTALQALDRLVNSGPGQLCVPNGTECMGGSKCQHGICQCPEGHTHFHGECLPPRAKMSPEKFRAQSLLFSPDFAVMDSPNSVPGSNSLQSMDENLQDPMPSRMVAAGAMCRLTLECPYRTECLRGVCRCKRGETIVNGVCRKTIHEVLPGGRCDTQKGLDCVGESHCFYGICVCLYGLVIVGHECANADVLKPVPPGGICSQGQQCQGRARCVRGKCQCPRGQRLDSESRRCIKSTTSVPQINKQPAHSEAEAPTASLIPLNVQQMPKFVYTIPAALAAAAEDGKFNQILTANQMSINLMDQQLLRSLLAPMVQPSRRSSDNAGTGCEGATCLVTSPPMVGSSTQAPLAFHTQFFASSTEPASFQGLPGHLCSPQQQCHGGAICLGGFCVCRPGFRPMEGFCQIAKVGLGQPCFINEQCKASGFCIDGLCRCRSELDAIAMPSTNRMAFHRHRCPVRPVAAVGDDCSRAQSCAWNSVCGPYSGVCECAVGLENNQGACVAARRPRGTECLSSSNCHKFGFCDNGYCVCKAGHQSVAGFCLPPPRPVIDDPKAYVDPDLMAALLKKQGITAVEVEHSAVNSPFGLRLAKLRTGGTIEDTNELGGDEGGQYEFGRQPWQITEKQQQQLIGDDTPNNAQDALAFGGNLGWPFQIGGNQMAQNDAAPAPENTDPMMIGFSPTQMLQHSPEREGKARGAKTFTLEERRQLLMRNSGKPKIEGQRVHKPALRKQGIAMPGEFCGNRERICLGNSICLAGWCQCPNGVRVEKGGMCAMESDRPPPPTQSTPTSGASHSPMKLHGREPHKPYESCANGPCIHGANCIRSAALATVQKLGPFCQCAPGTIFLASSTECVPRKPEMRIMPIGSHCPQPSICDFGSVCGPTGICQCPEGQKPVAGICVQIALPGESCARGEFCADGAVCAPGLDACVCPVGWKVRQGKCHRGRKLMARLAHHQRAKKRHKMTGEDHHDHEGAVASAPTSSAQPSQQLLVPLGEHCHSDVDCQGVQKAHCPRHSHRCTCLPGFAELYSSVCVPEDRIRLPGEECVASAHFCSGHSWCKEGTCQCFQKDMLALDSRCQPIPGQQQARTFRRHPQKPAPSLPPAKSCQADEDCPHGAECRGGDCLCNGLSLGQSLAASDEQQVEKKCTLDLDCPPVLGCHHGRCVCIRDEHTEANKTEEIAPELEWDLAVGEPVSPILPGTFCDAFSQCGHGAECFFGRCQCIFRDQQLAFVNGTTKCVSNKDGKSDELDYANKLGFRWRRHNAEVEDEKHFEEHSTRSAPIDNEKHANGKGQSPVSTLPPAKGPFASEPLATKATTASNQTKSPPPGAACGPLDICIGGAACVEGVCLCPAGTRPSALSPQCETFEQRKAEQEHAVEGHPIVAASTQPAPITASNNNRLPTIAKPSIVGPPLIANNSHRKNQTANAPVAAAHNNHSIPNCPPGRRCVRECAGGDCEVASSSNGIHPTNLINAKGPRRVPQSRPYARPSESCANGQICTGGSICQRPANVCECPAQKPLLRNHICIRSNEPPMLKAREALPGEHCDSETACQGGSICAEGLCRCQSGFQPDGLKCVPEATDGVLVRQRSAESEMPAPSEMLPPVKLRAESDGNDEGTAQESTDTDTSDGGSQLRSASRPRISGPPLRKTPTGASIQSAIAPSAGGSANGGVCPPGNVPTTDPATGQMLVCNGMTPNCPPKSYCFVTGEASETYNCCKAY